MSAPQSKSRLQIRGLLTIGDAIQQEIWLLASATLNPEGSAIADKINTTERQVRELCEQHAISPAQLPLQSQQVYAWLRLLSQPTMLAAHLETLRRLTQFIEQTPAAQKRRGDGVRWHVELAHCGYLYRSRTLPKQPHYWQLLFNECFIGAPEPVLYALAQLSFDRNVPALGTAKAYANSPAYHQIVLALRLVPAPTPAVLSGQHHDLQQVFARVNQLFFEGALPQPHLRWSRGITHRIMGTYQTRTDTVMISQTLDDVRVPEFVIDYVMYHELLHKQLGSRFQQGRRQVHFAEFRAADQRYPRFAEAEAFLNNWVGSRKQ